MKYRFFFKVTKKADLKIATIEADSLEEAEKKLREGIPDDLRDVIILEDDYGRTRPF